MELRDNRPLEIHCHVWSTDGIATIGRHGWTEGLVETIVFKGSGVYRVCQKGEGSGDRDDQSVTLAGPATAVILLHANELPHESFAPHTFPTTSSPLWLYILPASRLAAHPRYLQHRPLAQWTATSSVEMFRTNLCEC